MNSTPASNLLCITLLLALQAGSLVVISQPTSPSGIALLSLAVVFTYCENRGAAGPWRVWLERWAQCLGLAGGFLAGSALPGSSGVEQTLTLLAIIAAGLLLTRQNILEKGKPK